MGIKQTDIMSFIEPDSLGFHYETARSFLKRHSDPKALLFQIKSLLKKGQLAACEDMIQLIIREGHELADQADIYMLQAELSYIRSENQGVVMSWLQQARLCFGKKQELPFWDSLMQAKSALKEGDYIGGQMQMESLIADSEGNPIAKYELAYHLFWKNMDCERAMQLLIEVVQEVPEFIQAWSCLGFVYNKFGMRTQSQQAFGQCIELDSNPERLKLYKQQIAS